MAIIIVIVVAARYRRPRNGICLGELSSLSWPLRVGLSELTGGPTTMRASVSTNVSMRELNNMQVMMIMPMLMTIPVIMATMTTMMVALTMRHNAVNNTHITTAVAAITNIK